MIEQIVDRARYPIHDLASEAGQRLTAAGRSRLESDGYYLLPGFVQAPALERIVAEVARCAHLAYRRHLVFDPLRKIAGGRPGEWQDESRHDFDRMGVLAGDDMESDALLTQLYEWDSLTRFLGIVLGADSFHRCVDPLLSCTATVLRAGDRHGWHCDSNDFVVTLLLQAAEAGGVFEFAPKLAPGGAAEWGGGARSDDEVTALAAFFDKPATRVHRPPLTPGSLFVFHGRQSPHHVTTIAGKRDRLMAVFSYDTRSGVEFTTANRLKIAGRAEPRERDQAGGKR